MSNCIWYILWRRYLGDDPERYGSKISSEELIKQTSSNQQNLDFEEDR